MGLPEQFQRHPIVQSGFILFADCNYEMDDSFHLILVFNWLFLIIHDS